MPEFGQEPPSHPCPADIDLWLLSTEGVDPADLAKFKASLGPSEQAKLQPMRLPQVQQQVILSRGCLRYLLGQYTGQAPGALKFTYGPQGKPALDFTALGQGIAPRFNLSHSGQRLLIAVSLAETVAAIGVDLEVVRPIHHLPRLCQRYLTPTEAAEVLVLDGAQVNLQFLRYWTGKEACFKALGTGITDLLQSLELTLGTQPLTVAPAPIAVAVSDTEPKLLEHPGQLYQWQPELGYLAALAVQITPPAIARFRLYQTTPQALIRNWGRS